MVGPMNQNMQPMPQGMPQNIMALWAAMTPEQRAQYIAATQGASPQLASLTGRPADAPSPRNLSLTPAMMQQFQALQPQVQYGDPMKMRVGSDYYDAMKSMKDMGTGPYGAPEQ